MMQLELVGLAVLALAAANIWAIVSVIGSGRRRSAKALWTGIILFLPLAGFLAWLTAGPREREYRL